MWNIISFVFCFSPGGGAVVVLVVVVVVMEFLRLAFGAREDEGGWKAELPPSHGLSKEGWWWKTTPSVSLSSKGGNLNRVVVEKQPSRVSSRGKYEGRQPPCRISSERGSRVVVEGQPPPSCVSSEGGDRVVVERQPVVVEEKQPVCRASCGSSHISCVE
jgi:hypothetical protein